MRLLILAFGFLVLPSTSRSGENDRAAALPAAGGEIEAPRAGRYEVDLAYACDEQAGGGEVEVACGESKLVASVHHTGGADQVLTVPLGSLEVPEGASRITVRALGKPDSLKLRELSLKAGYAPLFDGKSMAGWRGAVKGYSPENGVLVCRREGGGNLYTEREYSDFSFRFEFKLFPGSNNGLGIRAPLEGDAAYLGMEVQILDDGHESYKNIQPWQVHGSIYDVFPAKRGHLRPTGEWNVEEVIARGRKVKVILNGVTIVDADLEEVKDPKKLEKHPGLLRKKGHIGFLGHGTRVEFRNIRLKRL